MAAAAILNFGKNVNNFGLDKDILHQIIWEDASRVCGDDRVTNTRVSKPEVNSRDDKSFINN